MLWITFTESHSPNPIHRIACTELKFEDLSHTHTHTFSVGKKARPAGWIYRVLESLSRHDVAGLDVALDAGLESGRRARALIHLWAPNSEEMTHSPLRQTLRGPLSVLLTDHSSMYILLHLNRRKIASTILCQHDAIQKVYINECKMFEMFLNVRQTFQRCWWIWCWCVQIDTFPATKWCVIQSPTCRTCRSWCSQPRCLLGVQAPPTCRKSGQAHAVHSGASLEDDLPKTLPLEKEQEKKENFPMNSNNAGPFSLISTSVAGSALWNMQWKRNERRGSMTHVRKSGKLSQRTIQWAYMSTINRRSIP